MKYWGVYRKGMYGHMDSLIFKGNLNTATAEYIRLLQEERLQSRSTPDSVEYHLRHIEDAKCSTVSVEERTGSSFGFIS